MVLQISLRSDQACVNTRLVLIVGTHYRCARSLLPLLSALSLMGKLKMQSNGQLYNNTVISTLAVDTWTVTFGTAKRGLDALSKYVFA